jgi:phosphonate transport system permease protein
MKAPMAAIVDLKSVAIPRRPALDIARPWLVAAVILALLAWSYRPAEVYKFGSLWTDRRNMAEFASAFLHPNFRYWELYLGEMLTTLQIAVWGTVLAVLVGAPCAILSSANVAPAWVVFPVRRLMDILRAINEMVLALFFLVAVGPGPAAGVLALFAHNIGVVAKLYSEAVEAIDPRPVEGIRATGGGRLSEVIYGVVPQVTPIWSSLALYRFETNVRSATVLGIIGAGGIGQTLYESARSFQYPETAALILIVVGAVMLIDMVSSWLRNLLV